METGLASSAKSQFLASMSHELRTPLNSIIGFANILLKNKDRTLTPAQLNFLDRIQANGNHLLGLINQILDLSKIEAQKVELHIGPVALDLLIRETVAQQEALVRDKPVQLVAELPEHAALLQTDAERLKQVIINLIGNALKFTERGNVTVRLLTDPDSHRPARIEVSDTGIGIPREKLGVIFEGFQQAEAGTARKYGGTGLGLTISQALCQLMGYRIEVSSEVGRGSTFSVVLASVPNAAPAPEPAPLTRTIPVPARLPAAAAAPAPRCAELEGKLVLVIDDELDSRTLLTHVIEEFALKMIDLFLSYTAQKLAEARQAHTEGKLPALAKAVHPIQSSAGNVGACRVQDLAARIESLATEPQGEGIAVLLAELGEAFDEVKAGLDEKKHTLASKPS